MIDTHAHLDDPQFERDRDQVIRRAFEAGVEAILNVGTDLKSSRASVALSAQYNRIYAAVGCHPHDADALSPDALSQMAEMARQEKADGVGKADRVGKVVAVGETGLDFYRDYSPRDIQRQAFREQIRLARKLNLPLIVHSRAADEETMAILREEKAAEVGGVLHCFPGDMAMAQDAIRMNFYIGLGGTTTFGETLSLAVARALPLERLLLETDCPYLAPVPHRGKRNEPAYVRFVAERIAQERALPLATLAATTSANAHALFRLRSPF